ncbi:fructose-bisphosphate aldolase [Trichophaea hybrida]|nr:fructose-bisphosphate aldolase [Trichophaea hybrida]
MSETYPHTNLTYRILTSARAGSYAVGAFNCYDTIGVLAVIRAAEHNRSPAIIQLFPWSIHFHGPHFLTFVVSAAHSASVPIAVHLDHCQSSSDVALALDLPVTFDSIMVDGDPEYVRAIVEKAAARGITVEAELGRVGGGEDGLPPEAAEIEAVLTDPRVARRYVEDSGCHFLAPSFGNIHGNYPEGGPEELWQVGRLAEIRDSLEGMGVEMVLHGTSSAEDKLIRKVIREGGVRKVNINKMVRDGYVEFLKENVGRMGATKLQEMAREVYTGDVGRVMREVLGSAGKA